MRIATALLVAVLLLALPACQMNERLSGAAFGGIGGAVVGGAIGGTFAGGVIGGLAGGVLGYLVGDYIADKRERCSPPVQSPCDPCGQPTYAPVQQPCYQPAPQYCPPQQPQYAPQYCPPQQPQYAPQYCPPPQQAPCLPPAGYGAGPRVGAVKARNPAIVASQAAVERGRRAATLPEARAAYEEAVRLDPQSADAWNALGLARGGAGDRDGALDAFGRALRLDPGHFAAKRNLAWARSGVR